MLDGSLIAYFAIRLAIPCEVIFAETAYDARPNLRTEHRYVEQFAEDACHFDNPDHLWLAAFIKSGFQSRLVITSRGNRYVGNEVDRLVNVSKERAARMGLSDGKTPMVKEGLYVGVFGLNFRKGYTFFDGSLANAISPRYQSFWLSESRDSHFDRCQIDWARCFFLKGATDLDLAAWKRAELSLAKAVKKILFHGLP